MVQSIGADTVIDYTREDFAGNGQRYDVIFDLVANHSFAEHRRALTPKGIYLGAGALSHESMIGILTSRITELLASSLVSQRFISFIAKLNQKDLEALGSLMADGKVTPVIDRCYSLSEVSNAVEYVEEKHARGKVILTVG